MRSGGFVQEPDTVIQHFPELWTAGCSGLESNFVLQCDPPAQFFSQQGTSAILLVNGNRHEQTIQLPDCRVENLRAPCAVVRLEIQPS